MLHVPHGAQRERRADRRAPEPQRLNLGAAILDAPGAVLDPEMATAIAAWGPGLGTTVTTSGRHRAVSPTCAPCGG